MVYRPEARIRIGPAAIQRFDPYKHYERLAVLREMDEAKTSSAVERAAFRRAAAETAAKERREAAAAQIAENMARRTAESQQRVTTYQTQTAGRMQHLQQQAMLKLARAQARNARLGYPGFTNPAVNGGQGAASIRNQMEGRGPTPGPAAHGDELETYKWGKFSLTTARGTRERFTGFLNALAATGYKIHTIGSYANRNARGSNRLSEHAHGNAIDINPQQNPMGSRLITDMPKNITQIAARYGLVWGGTWKSKKDAMHFSTTGY